MERRGIVRKLLFNALRYRLLKRTGRPGRLEAISLEVTHRCLCRCQMCNIWQIPSQVSDLPLSAWIGLLSSPELQGLRELDITGGEPFLRDDLAELLRWICREKEHRFPGLRTLAITTNGLLTERVLTVVEQLVAPLGEVGIDLVFACGLDGVGEVHDQIRRVPGAWQRLCATLGGLQEIRTKAPNLILGTKTTIVPENVGELERIAEFAQEHQLFTIISPRILTANRFGNLDLEERLQFCSADIARIERFFSGPAFAWSGHRLALLHYLQSGKMTKPCSAGFNTVFVRHTGEVFPCPLMLRSWGNAIETPLQELLRSPQAATFRKNILGFAECQSCTEPGLERIAWPFEGATALRFFLHSGFHKFLRLSSNMGIDKYF